MLANLNANQTIGKHIYKDELKPLQDRLAALQQRVRAAGLPVLIVFEGWGAAGKGTSIGKLVNPLDPRHFDVLTMGKISDEMLMRPFLWGYWCRIPSKGQITVIDKSWHRIILPEEREKWELNPQVTDNFYQDVNAFERQLTQDGTLLIKLFLHISQPEQARRFKALEEDPSTAWRVKPHDWAQNKNYDAHLKRFEQMLEMTGTELNPWHVVEADDRRYSGLKICRTIVDAIEARLEAPAGKAAAPAGNAREERASFPKVLAGVKADQYIENAEYKEELDFYQTRMNRFGHKMYVKRRPVIIVYEGWDAAGKGGNIKRLVAELDPRCYTVVPIGPPTPHELGRHYLWRFIRRLPKDGHFTIFDRSWYGRVLIERVESLTPEPVWRRAYDEINEMEQHCSRHGAVILKFWLHIDKDEQLKRFEARMNDPAKQHKITDADWVNRENWDAYEVATDEMFAKTHKPHAPWVVVESNNKKYARIKVLKTVTDALDEALK
ncbi:MAG: polyphosphate:AMP phosphotransferase [Defluviitaleaceae bacterium]|nr:polyphosphate:AMP phosphotransferase [Defluviitaleaceae bacterium]MCL2239698.1 polyphosphate:AMP phosphotransferase [Defluviitaleaceae bacterium]